MPIGTPSAMEIDTETRPARSEARVPQMTRESTSRPSSSPPKRYAALGARRTASQLVASGSCGAIQGANIAMTMKNATTPSPNIAPPLRRSRRQARRRGVTSSC